MKVINLEIVLVHLGGKVPSYLITNILNMQSQFPNTPINLVVDKLSFKSSPKIPGINYYNYSPAEEVNQKLTESFGHVAFRNGYWRLTYERLLALTDFHLSRSESSILHIESDILTFPNFPINELHQLDSIHWLASDRERDVASLIFLPNRDASVFLKRALLSALSTGQFVSDMLVLHNIREQYPTHIKLFPSLFSAVDKLGGLYDPAAYGMWLTGIDPRNNFGLTRYFDTETIEAANFYVKPHEFEYMLEGGNLFAKSTSGKELPIYCLHIHSKNKALLSSSYPQTLERILKKARKRKTRTSFSFTVLLRVLWMNIQQGTLIDYLGNIPSVRKIRKILNSDNVKR